MEFVALKKTRNRNNRKRNVKNRRRIRRKLEVKVSSRRTSSLFTDNMMDASTFWENYKLAQDWQQKHNVAWWKSRCYALQHENNVLRQKIRSQASRSNLPASSPVPRNKGKTVALAGKPDLQEHGNEDEDDENLEFHVDENMLDFLEQSIRHKMELKRCRESEKKTASPNAEDDADFVTCEARVLAKAKDARLLYGEASPTIMAMEAALQATIDRHKDRANPHYWPNIPLKP